MFPKKPDLSKSPAEIRTYIEALENEIERLNFELSHAYHEDDQARDSQESTINANIHLLEAPTTISLITFTKNGYAKRSFRHLYSRQRRGGMGIFDMETTEEDPPVMLTLADEDQELLLITNLGRAFRVPVQQINEAQVRSRGFSIIDKLGLAKGEDPAVLITDQAQGYLALASQSGMVRLLRHHVFGAYMKPGTSLFDYRSFGLLATACWCPNEGDLFVATKTGRAIRFNQRVVPPAGTQAIRLVDGDEVIGITSVNDESGVFLLGADGKGTIRLMSGFGANKAPGAGGKIALKTDHLICATSVDEQEDIFIITRLSKIIRFGVDEVPAKDGVVQGVNCISLRSDVPTAVATVSLPRE